LLEAAINGGGPDSRLIEAELTVKGVPVTEVDYKLKDKAHSVALVGFKDTVRGDLTLFDVERAGLYALIAVLALALVLALIIMR